MENKLQIGDKLILDKGWKGFEREVEVLYVTGYGNWCDVISTDGSRSRESVMTKRLSNKNG